MIKVCGKIMEFFKIAVIEESLLGGFLTLFESFNMCADLEEVPIPNLKRWMPVKGPS